MLLAYPKDYRRDHGAELLEPLVAESRRPTARELANLLVHGLRTRLGRPASRTVVAWAMLATVIAGVFGAAFGSWAGWQTARPLPQPAWTRALLADVVPGPDFTTTEPPTSSKFTQAGEPLTWHDADDLLLGEGDLYQPAVTVTEARVPATTDVDALSQHASSRLAATGWTLRSSTESPKAGIQATRDGLALTLEIHPAEENQAAQVSATFQRTTPTGAWIAGATGGAAVAAAAFLIFAWASRRTGRPDHPARLAVTFPFGLALLFWWVPTVAAPRLVWSRPDWRVEGPQLWELIGQPTLSACFLAGLAFATLSLFLASLPHRPELQQARPTPRRG
jgi:hypothetical protein